MNHAGRFFDGEPKKARLFTRVFGSGGGSEVVASHTSHDTRVGVALMPVGISKAPLTHPL